MPGLRHFRAFPRRKSSAAIVVRVGRAEVRGRLVDVGLGGAGLVTEGNLVVDSEVEVVITAPNRWDPLVLPARVAWVTGRRAGVAFRPREDADALALFEMLGTQVFD